jgi:uncharacterized protein (DUF488 family)
VPHTVFTLGYQGSTLPAVIAVLRAHHIARLVDVRGLPWSRKPGFARRPLAEALAAAGMAYVGRPELGSPETLRRARKEGLPATAFATAYLAHLERIPQTLAALADEVRAARCCLLCFEADAGHCHRSLLAARLQADWPDDAGTAAGGLAVVHLDPRAPLWAAAKDRK